MNYQTLEKFTPYMALIVYGDEHKHRHYLQVHDIVDSKWGEGKPFRREDLSALATSIKAEYTESLKLGGLMPTNVLYFDPGINSRFIWYLEPQKFNITFTADVKIPSGTYACPGLIMAVAGKDLYCYAVKGNCRPDLKTELFFAPFYNMYDDGSVCMGTVTESRRKHILEEEIDRWQRRFFGGRFTNAHDLNDSLANGWTARKLYKAMKSTFPEEALKQVTHLKTLKDLIAKLKGGIDA